MSARRKPHTDDQILIAIEANEGDLKKTANSLHHPLATIIKRLKIQPLRGCYRASVLAAVGGNITMAAEALGLSRQRLHALIDENAKEYDPVVDQGRAEGLERRLDFAESKLDENIAAGKEASIFFLLKTLGKDRGYTDRQEISGPEGEPLDMNVTINFVEPLKSGRPRAIRSRKKKA